VPASPVRGKIGQLKKRASRLVEWKESVLMRRLLVALCTLLALALVGPALVSAQDATPEADAGGTDEQVQRTDVRYLLPFGPDGLSADLTASATVEGVCGSSSIAAIDRPDAWDCMSADNEILDPCFENPFTSEVTLLTLTEPLVREKEEPDPGADPSLAMGQEADDVLDPWDLPWALELANGDRCTLLHGTLTVMAGQSVYYGCVDGGMVLGETDHSQPVWTVSYLAEGEFASSLVDVAAAWS
jgi:hypothetical protein